MQDAPGGSQHPPTAGYSLHEAAALLGVGVNTLRRQIAAGQVRAEQVQRPQGYVWRVYLDGRYPPTHHPEQESVQDAPGSLPHPPNQLAQAEALASLIQASLTPIVAPLVEEMASIRQASERKDAELRELERELGRVTALLDSARAQIRTLTPPTAPRTLGPTPGPSLLFLRRRWVWIVVLAAFVVATVLLLA